MKASLPLLALLFSTAPAFAALPPDIKAGEIVQVELAQLHPTQAAIGYRQLDYKQHRYQADPEKLFDDYCESMGQISRRAPPCAIRPVSAVRRRSAANPAR
ncbi:ParB-like protein [Pantoea sp. GM_Pan_4]|uniref:ParB-like protein n=1 Tax=Pantoea sp. GM_Pan_4 TaxID=2937389 RepID=UPI00226A8441|nr:ParB-like protein [Pantoea sp. GM_Pan_4]